MNIKIKKIETDLNKQSYRPYELSWIAYELVSLIKQLGDKETNDINILIEKFIITLKNSKLENLTDNQINYAIKLMKSNGLIYEEFNKLYSLFDEIYCLDYLGIKPNQALNDEYTNIKRSFLDANKEKLKIISNDQFENWKIELPWYNLD